MNPSPVRLLDYSKTVIPTTGQATLQCTHRGKTYKIFAQIIAAQRYYPSLLGLADSTRMGIINYDVDTAKQMEDIEAAPLDRQSYFFAYDYRRALSLLWYSFIWGLQPA